MFPHECRLNWSGTSHSDFRKGSCTPLVWLWYDFNAIECKKSYKVGSKTEVSEQSWIGSCMTFISEQCEPGLSHWHYACSASLSAPFTPGRSRIMGDSACDSKIVVKCGTCLLWHYFQWHLNHGAILPWLPRDKSCDNCRKYLRAPLSPKRSSGSFLSGKLCTLWFCHDCSA